MNRFGTATLAAALLTLALAIPAAAAPDDVKGPPCRDIVDGLGNTTPAGDRWTLNFQLTVAEPACKQFVYTVVVLESGTDDTVLASQTVSGGGETDIIFSFPMVDDDDTVCVYATTASKGGHVFDRAPDSGCGEIGPFSPGQGFN